MNTETEQERKTPGRLEMLAHDVRAALADVVGGLRLIEQDALSAPSRTQLERVLASSELLARLVDEVLDDNREAARGEVGALTDLRRLIEDELKRWRGAAIPQGIAVMRELGPGLPQLIRVDALPLRRILANAMGNAMRYAKTEIVLRAGVTDAGDIEMAIEDDGSGFDAALLPIQFEPSRRSEFSPGTGMGLHIAAGHAAAMGGRLWAGNRDEGGARIVLTLPGEVSTGPVPAAREVADLTGWRVLVADDSETVQALLTGMLGQLGAECEHADDGIVALNWLARERFDLALLDVEMPLLGGREVIRAERLRQARGVAPPTPLVALTAHSSSEMREALLDEGADGVFIKPIPDLETFGQMLSGMVDFSRGHVEWRPEAAPILSAVTLAELMMAAGPAHAVEMLDRMRDDLASVDKNLRVALTEDDMPMIRFHSHVLVSLAGALGALPTLSLARRLSDLARAGDVQAAQITGQVVLARLQELRVELEGAGVPQSP